MTVSTGLMVHDCLPGRLTCSQKIFYMTFESYRITDFSNNLKEYFYEQINGSRGY